MLQSRVQGAWAAQRFFHRLIFEGNVTTLLGRRLRNVATLDNRSTTMRIVDGISAFSGSLPFLWMHLGVFLTWILLNVPPLVCCRWGGFDPFPFGLLTMAVSLEAIVLSVLVLLSQNRQVARDRVRNDIEYEVNLKAELEVAHLHEVIDDLRVELLAKLEQLAGRQRPQ